MLTSRRHTPPYPTKPSLGQDRPRVLAKPRKSNRKTILVLFQSPTRPRRVAPLRRMRDSGSERVPEVVI